MMFRPLNDRVLVTDLKAKERMSAGGIIIRNDDGKLHGIRPRWAKIHAVGANITDLKQGQWILIKHGRWSRSIKVGDVEMWQVEYPESVLAVCDEEPLDEILSTVEGI